MPASAVDPKFFPQPAGQTPTAASTGGREPRSPKSAAAVASVVVLGLMWVVLLWRYRFWIATNDHAVFQLAMEQMRDGEIPLVGT